MDEAEGFFPQRRLLAYRRSLTSAEPVPESAPRQSPSAGWFMPVCLAPSMFTIGVSLYPRQSAYLLIASGWIITVLGIGVGIYRGLRSNGPR